MTLFLTSSPCVPNADRAILNPVNGFVDNLREALPPAPKCLFICSDPDSYDLTDSFGRDMADAFREAEIPFSEYTVLDGRNADAAAGLIEESDLVILAGGHVPTQNRFFRQIGLRGLLRSFPGTVMGISAGSMNAAAMVYAQPEMAGESIDPAYEKFIPGLDLTWLNILPHYQQVKDYTLDGRRLFEDITYADSEGHTFFALVDGSYILSRDGETWLLGEAYCIEDGSFEQISEEGDCIPM